MKIFNAMMVDHILCIIWLFFFNHRLSLLLIVNLGKLMIRFFKQYQHRRTRIQAPKMRYALLSDKHKRSSDYEENI